ncbi:MAG: BlaI/MecI/CopY family transcriptional regulator [Euryarchaeota archaeon]|nr:BlaI/MecI/CopY family transcriptional regulator [Euryarchaeota archaeon]
MASLRSVERATVRALVEALKERGERVTYATASTVLGRLQARGFISREKEEHRGSFRYVYRSLHKEEEALRAFASDVDPLLGTLGIPNLSWPPREVTTLDEHGDGRARNFRPRD